MERLPKFFFMWLIPIGIIAGFIGRQYHNYINRINRTPSMDGAFSLYAFSFLGIYLAIVLSIFLNVSRSDMGQVAKSIIITIIIFVSLPILALTYISL